MNMNLIKIFMKKNKGIGKEFVFYLDKHHPI